MSLLFQLIIFWNNSFCKARLKLLNIKQTLKLVAIAHSSKRTKQLFEWKWSLAELQFFASCFSSIHLLLIKSILAIFFLNHHRLLTISQLGLHSLLVHYTIRGKGKEIELLLWRITIWTIHLLL